MEGLRSLDWRIGLCWGCCRIRYPDPAIKVNDTVKIDLATGKITDSIRFDTGVIAMATGGRNMGRVGVITHRERHDGGFNIVHIKDAIDNSFATRESNVFVIGSEKPWISLPKGKGVKVRPSNRSVKNPTWMHIDHFLCSCRLQKREIVVGLTPSLDTRGCGHEDVRGVGTWFPTLLFHLANSLKYKIQMNLQFFLNPSCTKK